jgi:hypothetical protein
VGLPPHPAMTAAAIAIDRTSFLPRLGEAPGRAGSPEIGVCVLALISAPREAPDLPPCQQANSDRGSLPPVSMRLASNPAPPSALLTRSQLL